jgi:uncharacterized protein (DUF1697 family)
MPTYVALLRGINVGGRSKVAMPALRELVSSLGHADVATYIQSGNVIFSSERSDLEALGSELEQAIADKLGVEPRVIVLSCGELAQAARQNPYKDEQNPRAVHAIFLSDDPGTALVEAVAEAEQRAAEKGARDSATVVGRTVYVHTPDGYGRSELAARLSRGAALKPIREGGTARNWATVTKLLELCRS